MNLPLKFALIASASILLPASTTLAGGSGVSPKAGSAVNGSKPESDAQAASKGPVNGTTPLGGSNSTAITSGHAVGASGGAAIGK